MPNPLKSIGMMNNIVNAINMARGIKNPMVALQQMAQTNPQVANAIKALNSGADPQQVFKSLCSQQGVDPNDILNMMR